MRKAAGIWNIYKNNSMVQDGLETLLGAGVAAGGQALFTDMTPEEIAISSGLEIVGATALRPAMGHAGYAIGKPLDKAFPKMGDNVNGALGVFVSPGSPQTVKYMKAQPGDLNKNLAELAEAKYNQNFKRKDGTERGFIEGTVGTWGRQYGDNVAQMAVALATPKLFDNIRSDERQLEEIAELETALANLKGGVQ